MDFIELEIVSWEKYNPRKDYKKPRWFAVSNLITSDDMFSVFSDAEFKAWIHILCTASVQNTNVPKMYFKHAERACGIKRKTLISTVSKLEILKVIRIPAVICTDHVHDPGPTEQRITENNNTCRPGADLPLAACIWNQEVRSLPKIKAWSPAREAAKKKLGVVEEEWAVACRKCEASEFLSGRNGKWTACCIDWLQNPKNFQKVIEGNYDNRGPALKKAAGDICGVADV